MVPLGVGEGTLPVVGAGVLPVVGVGALGELGVTVGRFMVGVGTVGVGPAGVRVARRGVGEGMLISVASGAGVPSNEIEQPLKPTSRASPGRIKTIFFISLLSVHELYHCLPLNNGFLWDVYRCS
jgi:hypothetical protein